MTARASLFTYQRMSGLPILAKYKHFKTNCEHTLDKSPTVPSSSILKLWSSKRGVETLYKLISVIICQFTISVHALCRIAFHVTRPNDCLCVGFLPPMLFFSCSCRNSRFEHLFILLTTCIHVEYIPNKSGQEMMSVLQDKPASSNSSTWDPDSAFFQPLCMSSTFSDKNRPCFL